MTKSAIDQKEYLKKYLRSDKDVKQKKKKSKIGSKTVKIIDDDIDLNHIRPVEDGEFDILNSTEDAPQIVGIIDERGPVDFADKRRWKIIADDGEGNVAVSCSQTKSRDIDESVQKSMKLSKIQKNSSENGNYNENPSRKSRKQSDDDLSPPRKTLSKKKSKKHRRKSSSSDSTTSSSSSSLSDSSDSETDKIKRKAKSKESPKKHRNHEDSDLSPPRPRKSKDSDELSCPRKSKKKTETPRRRTIDIDSDFGRKSQKIHRQKNEDSDLSPPRSRRRKDTDSDLSPPRKFQADSRSVEKRRDNDSDMSPPRKSRREETTGSKGNRRLESDLSPPRRYNKSRIQSSKQNRGSDSDLSPPRNQRNDKREDRSETRRRTSDSSRRNDDRGARKKSSRWDDHRERRKSRSPDNDRKMKKTLDGRVAGLQDAKAMREETLSYKEREKEIFSKMSAEISGEGRAPVLRDRKTGKRRNLEAEAAEKREKEKKQEEIDEKYAKWGRGLKQVDDHNEKLMDDLYEMSKPLARYADDVDLDARQRATEYAEDPMLSYIKGKQIKEGKRKPDAPTYEGSFMPNRFGIKPGHRWDGVDRSNGYEKKWFEARNAKAAVQEEAYKWSTADM